MGRNSHGALRPCPGVADVGEEAVRAATGRGWSDWSAVMDRLGGADHSERVRRLAAAHPELSGWWCQSVVVRYERARGLRAVGETSKGFQVSVQRTVPGPAPAVWAAVLERLIPGADWTVGAEWPVEGASVTVRVVRTGQLRFWWHAPEGRSTVVVSLEDRGDRAAVRVGQEGLPAPDDVEVARDRWRAALARVAPS